MENRIFRYTTVLAALIFCFVILFAFIDTGLNDKTYSTPIDEGSHFQAPKIIEEHFGKEAARAFPPIILSISTILGIVASIIWEHSESRRSTFSLRNLAPLVISPIVLLFTYSITSEHPSTVVGVLLAFQNGFFWQIVIGRREDSETKA